MELFINNIVAFPTVMYTIMLGVVVLYWLMAMTGLLEVDILDLDPGHEPGAHFEVDMHAAEVHHHAEIDGHAEPDSSGHGGLSVLMLKLGLTGVPLTIIVTFLVLIGWFITYFATHLVLRHIPVDLLRWALGLVAAVVALVIAVPITAVIIKPLRVLFKKAETITVKHILGQVAIVRTSKVTESFGEANLDDGGAGLIVKIRHAEPNELKRGDRVVLLEYRAAEHVYRVVTEEEFQSG